jgi:hypothetical protein
MDFTKITQVPDEDGNPVDVTENFHATLTDGVAEIFAVDSENNHTSVVLQPWKTQGDGSRIAWTDLNEVVAWYQAQA